MCSCHLDILLYPLCCYLLYIYWQRAKSWPLLRTNQLLVQYIQALLSLDDTQVGGLSHTMATPALTCPSSPVISLSAPAIHSHRHCLDTVTTYNAAPPELPTQALLCLAVTPLPPGWGPFRKGVVSTSASLAPPVLCSLLIQEPFPFYPAWISRAVFLYSLLGPTFLYSHFYSHRPPYPSVASICLRSIPRWAQQSVSLCLHPCSWALPNEADWFHYKFNVINFKQVLTLTEHLLQFCFSFSHLPQWLWKPFPFPQDSNLPSFLLWTEDLLILC